MVIDPAGGADILLPVHVAWDLPCGFEATMASIVAMNVDETNFAHDPRKEVAIPGLQQVGRTSSFQANLHGPSIFSGRGDHGLAFDHVVTDGFLNIDIRSSLACLHHR